jgi:hypothetical protein
VSCSDGGGGRGGEIAEEQVSERLRKNTLLNQYGTKKHKEIRNFFPISCSRCPPTVMMMAVMTAEAAWAG